jgi:hypothetical protein
MCKMDSDLQTTYGSWDKKMQNLKIWYRVCMEALQRLLDEYCHRNRDAVAWAWKYS